jgi:beta-ribofuranosylaminobenzene 5'-phosphate synthase
MGWALLVEGGFVGGRRTVKVLVRCFPRIHLGLLDLSGIGRRIYGGAGFSLSGPAAIVIAETSTRTEVTGARLAADDVATLERKVLDLTKLGTRLSVEGDYRRHVGLGSGTMLTMAVLAATNQIHRLGLSSTHVSRVTGRGGASGVGWHAFWRGGFIVDGGQPNVGQRPLPSSASRPIEPPPLLVRSDIPLNWEFVLLLPTGAGTVSGDRERQFFERHVPTPAGERLAGFEALFHGIVPAVMSADLSGLRDSLMEYQSVGFKVAEIVRQSRDVRMLLGALGEVPACAFGMSSLGPLIFAIHDRADETTSGDVERLAHEHSAMVVSRLRGRNFGHSVRRQE